MNAILIRVDRLRLFCLLKGPKQLIIRPVRRPDITRSDEAQLITLTTEPPPRLLSLR